MTILRVIFDENIRTMSNTRTKISVFSLVLKNEECTKIVAEGNVFRTWNCCSCGIICCGWGGGGGW